MSTRNIGRRLQRKMSRIMAKNGMNSGPVILRWREASAPPASFDRNLQVSKASMTYQDRTEERKAFIHYVSIHTTGYTRFMQVKSGDVILDFLGDVEIDGRADLEFDIGGEIYVQKNGGDELAKSWDTRCGGVAITRTVLVTLKS